MVLKQAGLVMKDPQCGRKNMESQQNVTQPRTLSFSRASGASLELATLDGAISSPSLFLL